MKRRFLEDLSEAELDRLIEALKAYMEGRPVDEATAAEFADVELLSAPRHPQHWTMQ